MRTVHALLTGIVDYAGLFPPSKLDMGPAVSNYAKYRDSDYAWMLGRFIVPIARLDEFESNASEFLPMDDADDPWLISALPGADLDKDIDRVFEFNRKHAEAPAGLATIDSLEIRLSGPGDVDRMMRVIPEQLQPFFEAPTDGDMRGVIASIAGTGAHAKIRCGGVSPDLFPTVETLSSFIASCAAAGVAFKATAGLHHPIRSEHALTYEEDSVRGVMHGFLNVFLAAAFAKRHRLNAEQISEMLNLQDASQIFIDEDGVRWNNLALTTAEVEQLRGEFAMSFGSCSFDEPVEDLQTLGLL